MWLRLEVALCLCSSPLSWTRGTKGIDAHPALLTGALLYAGGLSACLWWDAKLVGRVGGPDLRLLLASYAGFCVSMPTLVCLYSGVRLFIPLAALGPPGLSTSPTRRRGFALALGLTMLPVRSLDLTLGTGWAGTFNLLPILGTFLLMVEALGLRLDLRRQSASSEADDVSTPPRTEAVARAG